MGEGVWGWARVSYGSKGRVGEGVGTGYNNG